MKKNKIILCTLNSKYVHASLGIYYLNEGLKKYAKIPYESVLIEGTINEDIEEFAIKVIKESPSVIGLSCYIWNISKTYELINILKKKLPQLIVVLGGPEVSFNQSKVMENSDVDYIISSKGEKSFADLINELFTTKNFKTISALTYRENEAVFTNDKEVYKDYLNPYSNEFMDNIKGRIVYLEASRGCPFSCAFCLSGIDDHPQYFDFETVKNNIIKLSHSSTKTIKFVDRTFNANVKRSNEILDFIINDERVNKDVTFHFEIAGDLINAEFLTIISKAKKGLIQFEIGLQTFNEKTLIEINRKTNIERLVNNIKDLVSLNNCHVHIDLIAGLPYEDLTSFKNSFNTAFILKSQMLQLGFLKLLHGSTLRINKDLYFNKYDENPPYEVIETKWISHDELQIIHKVEDILERMVNSGRFVLTIDYLLNKTNLEPFDLMLKLAENLTYDYQISLDDFTRLLINYDESLRDVLVLDRLASNKTGTLIKELKVDFKSLKRYRLAYNKINPEKKGIKRGFEYLVNTNNLVFVDYENIDLISNRYELTYLELDSLDITKV